MTRSLPFGGPAVLDDQPSLSEMGTAVRPITPPLKYVSLPFRAGQYQVNAYGTATGTLTYGFAGDADGDGSALVVSVPANITSSYMIKGLFYGRGFGIRFLRSDSSSCQDFTVSVDGVARKVAGQYPNMAPLLISETDGVTNEITHDDLEPGVHDFEILIPAGPANTNNITLLGYLVEERPGHQATRPQNTIGTPAYVPNSAGAIPQGTSPQTGQGLTGILYTNINAGAQIVTINVNGVQAQKIYLAAPGAGDSAIFTIPGGLANSASAITHVCGTASAVYATPIYGG